MKKFLIIVAAICTAGVLGVVALVAMLGAAANSVDKSIKAEQANDRPHVVAEGAAFNHDGYAVAKGWKVTTDQFGYPAIKGLRVTNVGHATSTGDSPMFTFSLWRGKANVAEINATGRSIAKGQSTTLDASSLDKAKVAGTTIKVADLW